VLRSLRFRLPAFFLASIVLAGIVAAAIAFRLLDSYTLSRARADLKREASGLTQLYAYWTAHSNLPLPGKQLSKASGDRLYFIPAYPGFALFPKEAPRFQHLSRRTVPIDDRRRQAASAAHQRTRCRTGAASRRGRSARCPASTAG